MEKFWKIALGLTGLGGLAAFVLWSLYREWLRLPIFQVMTKGQQYNLFLSFIILTFLFAIAALIAHVYISNPPLLTPITLSGNVLTQDGLPVQGATVYVEGVGIDRSTDRTGWFTIEVNDRPEWTIRARYEAATAQATLRRSEKETPIRLTLPNTTAHTKAEARAERFKNLVAAAEEILEVATQSLMENQEALAPLFAPHFPNAKIQTMVYRNMVNLYHNQRNRGDFGRWRAFLEVGQDKEEDLKTRFLISDLIDAISKLADAFYLPRPHPSKNTKLSVVKALAPNEKGPDAVNDGDILEIADRYLNDLRSTVEKIGEIVGKLKAMA